MDERAQVQATVALRLVADLMTALVISGTMPKRHMQALVDDSLNALLRDEPPGRTQLLRETMATLTASIEVADATFQARLRDE